MSGRDIATRRATRRGERAIPPGAARGAERRFRFALPGVLALAAASCMASGPTAPDVVSLVNAPRPIAPRAVRLPKGPGLLMELRFTNECLADAGAEIFLADAVLDDDRVRIVLVGQRTDPRGCPDIFMPTVRSYAVEMPADGAAAADVWVFIDEVLPDADAERGEAPFVLDVAGDLPPADPEGVDATVPATRSVAEDEVPRLHDVVVQAKGGAYEVAFDVADGLRDAHLALTVYAGRDTGDAEGATDWLLVTLATDGGGTADGSSTDTSGRHTFTVADGRVERAVVLNPVVSHQGGMRLEPVGFTAFDLAP